MPDRFRSLSLRLIYEELMLTGRADPHQGVAPPAMAGLTEVARSPTSPLKVWLQISFLEQASP